MSEEKRMTYKDAAQTALDAHGAVNLSGVVLDFARVVRALWGEANLRGRGTEWVNTHPIVVLFVSKLASLSGYEQGDTAQYLEAHETSRKILLGEDDGLSAPKEGAA